MAEHDQQFDTFTQWVNKASSWLTRRDDDKAICYDSMGRSCRQGSDFARARDEGTFPVRWTWEGDTVQVPREATEFLESITDEQWQFIADHRPDLIRRLLATAKTERAAAPRDEVASLRTRNASLIETLKVFNQACEVAESRIATLTAEREIDQKVIAWANNSLFGSHNYFLSLIGGEADEQHLARAIEELKETNRKRYVEFTTLTAERNALLARIVAISDLISVQQNVSSPLHSALTFIEINNLCSLTTQPSKTETRHA